MTAIGAIKAIRATNSNTFGAIKAIRAIKLKLFGAIPKDGKDRFVSINQTVREMLEGLPRTREYFFPSPKTGGRLIDVKFRFDKAKRDAGIKDNPWPSRCELPALSRLVLVATNSRLAHWILLGTDAVWEKWHGRPAREITRKDARATINMHQYLLLKFLARFASWRYTFGRNRPDIFRGRPGVPRAARKRRGFRLMLAQLQSKD